MLNSIVAILTTSAIAVHAVLGCCVHHSHVCESFVSCSASSGVNSTCSHDHGSHDHHGTCEAKAHSQEQKSGEHSGHQDECPHHSCNEADCSFISAERDDVHLMLSFSMCEVALSTSAMTNSIDGLLTESSFNHHPPDSRIDGAPLRSLTQVWRL